ncbi:phosphoenolpyruvate-protein phosphotransferase [Acididesulfobacillus acetoxydans]|uniref:Phosphoenolpyruvate-protein phosphotransferase n=2 Tax=Acididesulfobacillus acetoxydans TaxID=1561005 RepID=A0A8S0X198_9FIRM|nr:phosphoenolpyruvate--protein phosphotransferase [Acididesulfobacillus acetoxydans]CAA7603011.1 phosphoenolpyruvate-protein phosphotransferase [Acididesulfobacillus acetoxydans]
MQGIGVSPGIAIGEALVLKDVPSVLPERSRLTAGEENERLSRSLSSARRQLEKIRAGAEARLGNKAQILDAQILITEDEELLSLVREKLKEGLTAEAALRDGVEYYANLLENMDNEYLRERAADIRDTGRRIIRDLMGVAETDLTHLGTPCIIVAHDLTPSDTATMAPEHVLGFITDVGGRTSHSAIMARTLEIPAIVGTVRGTELIRTGDSLILDGNSGEVIVNPEPDVLGTYREKQRAQAERKEKLQALKGQPTVTHDGRKVIVAANIGTPKDCEGALRNGAEGVGLFRTEFLYLNREDLPGEEEQFQAYKEVLEAMAPREVVIRTLDVGGDKELPYLGLAKESNPFLGYRAIRVCLDRPEMFKTQLRALLRASVYGKLGIMFPMISSLEEVRRAKGMLAQVREELVSEGVAVSEEVEVGIMIEIPAAAVMSDVLAREVDFFSIGTNDLIQYTTAVDRLNGKIASLYTPYHPAVLRLVRQVIENGHKFGIWVGMCGEAAGDQALIPLLLGMGLDEFSMSAISVLESRELLGRLNYAEAQARVTEVLALGTAAEVKEALKKF